MPRLRLALVIGATVAMAGALAAGPAKADGVLVRISTPVPGLEGEANGDSYAHALSADGRYVAFASDASNLVADDTNGHEDVFVRDQLSGTVTRVSVAVDGRQVLADSSRPVITDDGRFVAFASRASKLVAGDANRREDVFVRDLQAGTTARVSVGAGGIEANGDSRGLAMSPDGRYVAFTSGASNLASRDTNRRGDVFLRDLQAGTTTRVSLRTDGGQGDDDASPLGEVAVSVPPQPDPPLMATIATSTTTRFTGTAF